MTDNQRDLEAVRVTVGSVAHHIDSKRWTELRSLYARDVETDYTSLLGGTPQRQTGDALIAGWRGALEKVATQHLLGPIEAHIDGSIARARCHVRALHHARGVPGGEQWEVLGHYVFDLSREASGWKITRMKLETLLQTGNVKLLSEASAIRE
ncbi:MAG: nuclear transport factor 2 family protein [Gemmatimonadaceae bacterium]